MYEVEYIYIFNGKEQKSIYGCTTGKSIGLDDF